MIIILDNIRSAHNVGSIIRTADALGIKDIYFCGITPDPLSNNKVIKTSLGAEKNIKIIISKNILEVILDLKDKNMKIIGLEISKNSININKFKENNIALVVGNEVSGLSEEVINICDLIVNIPMKGIKESLNVSVAFGIAAYTIINNIDN